MDNRLETKIKSYKGSKYFVNERENSLVIFKDKMENLLNKQGTDYQNQETNYQIIIYYIEKEEAKDNSGSKFKMFIENENTLEISFKLKENTISAFNQFCLWSITGILPMKQRISLIADMVLVEKELLDALER